MTTLLNVIAIFIFTLVLGLLSSSGLVDNIVVQNTEVLLKSHLTDSESAQKNTKQESEKVKENGLNLQTPAPKIKTNPVEQQKNGLKAEESENITSGTGVQALNDTLAPTNKPNTPTFTQIPFDGLNEKVRAVVVNIICTSKTGGSLAPASGSGVIIDPQGVILTNAHLAEYFLLKDYPAPNSIECVIRNGSPAYPKFKAELLYTPPKWVTENKKGLLDEKPAGTGEYDYALLRITKSVNENTALPESFPYLEIETGDNYLIRGNGLILAAYPAGFLGGINIQRDLYLSSAPTAIGQLYTFATSTIDIISLGGTIVAQQGSSGGAVALQNGKLVGIIVNTTLGDTTSERDLRALTLNYINRSLKENLELSLREFLMVNLTKTAKTFNQTIAPILSAELISVLEGNN
ncbi:MAG: hypothetical protein UX94_C0003G0005 [Parcubacteria group bacterium GW2011_GWA2_47_21]|nr:MAG: hypothetical protein UX94_C0003G0005 [Parcubacteria group bacterium GW2011_GWA2_47_21]